jgi:hypothetical protein
LKAAETLGNNLSVLASDVIAAIPEVIAKLK